MIYTYVIHLLLLFALGKYSYAIDNVQVETPIKYSIHLDRAYVHKDELTDLPVKPLWGKEEAGINSYKFLNVSFKECLYAFQSANVSESDSSICIWSSSNNGVGWLKKTQIPCKFASNGGSCDVMSTMVSNDELVVIYGNNTEYAIAKSKDGLKWNTSSSMNRESMNGKKKIYYSGLPFDPSDSDNKKKKYIMCYSSTEIPDEDKDSFHAPLGTCFTSDDEGASWKVSFYVRVKKTEGNVNPPDQIFYFRNKIHFVTTVDGEKNVFFTCELFKENGKGFHCENVNDIRKGSNPIMNMNTTENDMIYIARDHNEYTIFLSGVNSGVYGKLLKFKNTGKKNNREGIATDLVNEDNNSEEVEQYLSSVGEVDRLNSYISFHIIIVNESVFSIIYEYKNQIHHIHVEIKKKKQGCQFISCNENNKDWCREHAREYDQAFFYTQIDSQMEKICFVREGELANDKEYVRFFVKVPADIDFETSDKCFNHSYITVENNTPVHENAVIKIKNVVVFDDGSGNQMKEIEFFYPARFYKMVKYTVPLMCDSTNSSFKIKYIFPNDLRSSQTIKFPIFVRDFSVATNRLSLNKYDWNNPETKIPKGSYIFRPIDYITRFQLYTDIMNNVPNAQHLFEEFHKEYGNNIIKHISMPTYKDINYYEGIDLTDSSTQYTLIQADIQEDKTFTIDVVVPKGGITVGLVCPFENAKSVTDDLHCFDDVIDLNSNMVRLDLVFGDVPFFIAPKTVMYNKKLLAAESLLYLNKDSYNELDKIITAIHFRCACKVNNHTVHINFAIGTSSSSFSLDTKNLLYMQIREKLRTLAVARGKKEAEVKRLKRLLEQKEKEVKELTEAKTKAKTETKDVTEVKRIGDILEQTQAEADTIRLTHTNAITDVNKIEMELSREEVGLEKAKAEAILAEQERRKKKEAMSKTKENFRGEPQTEANRQGERQTDEKRHGEPQTQTQAQAYTGSILSTQTGTSIHNIFSSFVGFLILFNVFFLH